jgi:hypothetical protein
MNNATIPEAMMIFILKCSFKIVTCEIGIAYNCVFLQNRNMLHFIKIVIDSCIFLKFEQTS